MKSSTRNVRTTFEPAALVENPPLLFWRRLPVAGSGATSTTHAQVVPPGSNGEPSANDFQTFELLRIVERFATGFDDGSVELVQLDIDTDNDW